MRRWQTAVDVALFLALWAVAPLLLGGCGDDPCGGCEPGEICQQAAQRPGDRFLTTRWQCLRVTKEVVRLSVERTLLSVDGVPSGGSEVNGSMGDDGGTAVISN